MQVVELLLYREFLEPGAVEGPSLSGNSPLKPPWSRQAFQVLFDKMPPKNEAVPAKRGRGRPPKGATATPVATKIGQAKPRGRPPTTVAKEVPAVSATPSKRGPGRPPKGSTTPKAAIAIPVSPAKKRGRPVKSQLNPGTRTPDRPSHQKAPAKIASAGVKKRGRPAGSTSTKKTAGASKMKTSISTVSNLSSNLKALVRSASKGQLVELVSVLCEQNAIIAEAISNALREERLTSEEIRDTNGEEIVEDAANALEAEGHGENEAQLNGTEKAKGKAKANKDVTVDADQQVHTVQDTEPKSGYEADVEPEIPATATEAGGPQHVSQEDAIAETETIAEAVSSMRDSAFAL